MNHLYTFILLFTTITLHAGDLQQLSLPALIKSNNLEEILEHLNHEHFDVNAPIDLYGKTVLHHACGHLNSEPLVRGLILRKAHIDAQNSVNDETPLHEAAYCGHSDIVRILLESGADRNNKTCNGKTPADLARENGHNDTAELIDNWDDGLDIKEADVC